ncbi:MAG: VWA domain-containing protein [Nannocystaceae bacterium]|nr:VWA domain-containing protein [Nannocystaceae bacterium]
MVGMSLAACAEPTLVLGAAGTTGGSGVDPTAHPEGSTGIPDLPPFSHCGAEQGCQNKIDLLFVIDNSGTMGEEQLNLAKNFPLLVEQLQALEDVDGTRVGADVNIMVTTTDVDNPSCHGAWVKPDYVPARGAPVSTPCTERIARFTGLGNDPLVVEQACTDVCAPALPVAPSDQFIHFDAHGDNVADGDAAAALACVGPQGIDGCGYESPLEAMSQALNPGACWNDPAGCDDPRWSWIDEPFLRDGAVLAIAIITDETDCSVRDYGIMNDPDFEAVNPVTEIASPSSALCWHAGAACNDFDPATGVYGECVQTNRDDTGLAGVADEAAVLQPISRYTKLLQSLRDQGREVIMLGILGVPEVTAHADVPPYNPTAGGVDDLVYRLWRDPQYPDGDVLPDEWARGVDAAYKQFEFGIGPGCTGYDDAAAVFTGQAVADVRIRSVCESLNTPDDPATSKSEARVRCCIESICDDDFSAAIGCLTGLIQTAVTPVG